ncbi:hypothetical protein ACFRKB_38595 [Streptomyces scopuliridis]|uniref:hypothetical protein n=1 Tax=Streptomyces scopuliridis TaxID=452529 RepID=UPI0036B111C3
MGKPVGEAEGEVEKSAVTADYYARHGAAMRSVCPDFCAPIIRIEGMLAGPTYGDDKPTHRRQFYWPSRYAPETD